MISMGKALDVPETAELKESSLSETSPVFLSEVAFEPGLFDKLDQIEQLGIPDDDTLLLSCVSPEGLLGFTSQTRMCWSEHITDLLYGKMTYRDFIREKGIFRDLVDRMKDDKMKLCNTTCIRGYWDLHRKPNNQILMEASICMVKSN